MKTSWLIGGGIAAGVLLFASKSRASVRPGEPLVSSNAYWDWPVPGSAYLTSLFGCRNNIPGISFAPSECGEGRNFHSGIDLAAPSGTPIFAAGTGEVTKVKSDAVSGNFVSLSHGSGWGSTYCHLDRALVSPGQRVEIGEPIGVMDNTGASKGSHLHFMTTLNGTAQDPQAVIGRWPGPRSSGLAGFGLGFDEEDDMRFGVDLDLAVSQSRIVDPDRPMGGCCGRSALGRGFSSYGTVRTPGTYVMESYTVRPGDDVRLSAIARKVGLSVPDYLTPAERAAVTPAQRAAGWEGWLGGAKLIAEANDHSWLGPDRGWQTYPVLQPGDEVKVPRPHGSGSGGGGGWLLAAAAAFLLTR